MYEHSLRWTELLVPSDIRPWSGVTRAAVQQQSRIKHQRRNIYQPQPEGRFTAPVVPPCLKDDTVYAECLKGTENSCFIFFFLQERAAGCENGRYLLTPPKKTKISTVNANVFLPVDES